MEEQRTTRRIGKGAVLALAFIALFLVATAGAAVLTDLLGDDTEVVTGPHGDPLPAPTRPSTGVTPGDGDAPGDGSAETGETEAGGVLLPTEVPSLSSPFGPGTRVTPEGQPAVSVDPPEGADGTPLPAPESTPAPEATEPEPQKSTIYSFLDTCADHPEENCPFGVAGTILLADDLAPLRIRIWPELTKADHPDLRCDPGNPSGSKVPVVVTSNRPLDNFSYTFETEGGQLLEQQTGLRTSADEFARFDDHGSGQVIDLTSFKDSVQTCFLMRTDASGDFNVSRTQLFALTVAARAFVPPDGEPTETTETVSFNGTDSHPSAPPPVSFWPEDEHNIQMLVPQQEFDKVNVSLEPGLHDIEACEPGTDWVPQPNTLEKKPGPGAYDPDYTHYTVWDFPLDSGAEFTVCVKLFRQDQPVSTEAYHLEAPHAFSLGFEIDGVAANFDIDKNEKQIRVGGADVCDQAGRIDWPAYDLAQSSGQKTSPYQQLVMPYIHGLCWTKNRPIPGVTTSYGTRFIRIEEWDHNPHLSEFREGVARFAVPTFDPPSTAGCPAPPYQTGDCVARVDVPMYPRTACSNDFDIDFHGAGCVSPQGWVLLNVYLLGGPARPADRGWVYQFVGSRP